MYGEDVAGRVMLTLADLIFGGAEGRWVKGLLMGGGGEWMRARYSTCE